MKELNFALKNPYLFYSGVKEFDCSTKEGIIEMLKWESNNNWPLERDQALLREFDFDSVKLRQQLAAC